MADFAKDIADDGTADEKSEIVERVAEETLDDIEHGRVTGDTVDVLADRLQQQGVRLRDEAVDSLAEDIEEEASR